MEVNRSLLLTTIEAVLPKGVHDIQEFATLFESVHLDANEFFLKEGSVCSSIGFILNGMIRHYYINDSIETTRWVSKEGEFVTALGSFLQQKPSSHYLQAIVSCDLLVISKSDFEKVYKTNPSVQQLWLRMMEHTCLGFEDRIYIQLSSDAEKRYLYMIEKWPQLIEKVPQKYIASMMGIKPESLSRLRSKLAKKGIS
jgi:CRP-like cAMP-binding protein